MQLHYGILKDESLAEELLKHGRIMGSIIKQDKVSELLQARIGALLLHSSLTAAISNDLSKLTERITNILFTMTNSELAELQNLAIWSLRQLYIKCTNSAISFDYQDAFFKARAIKTLVPKLIVRHRLVQENTLLCLGVLFENKEMKGEFIDWDPMRQVMDIGEAAFAQLKAQECCEEDTRLLAAFASAICRLVDDKQEFKEAFVGKHNLLALCIESLKLLHSRQDEHSVSALQWLSSTLVNILANGSFHEPFLQCDSLCLLSELFHSPGFASYEQLKVDNNAAHCYSILALNPKSHFHAQPLFKQFTEFINQVCDLYEKTEYLSKTEVDTHFTLVCTLKGLIYRQLEGEPAEMTDDRREEFLQTLNSAGGLEPLLVFEHSNVPKIRELAEEVLERLAPSG